MNSNTVIEQQQAALPNPAALWVHEVLEPDQFSTAKQPFAGLCRLDGTTGGVANMECHS